MVGVFGWGTYLARPPPSCFVFDAWGSCSVVHDLVVPRFRACLGQWFGFVWLAVDVAEREVAGR
jgi:hypothetical protein